jgi:hypothetical protein
VLFRSIKGKEVTSKTTASGISRTLTGLQNSSGKNIIQELAAQPGGLEKIDTVSQNLGGLLEFRGKLKGNLAKNQKIADQATKTTAAGLGQARNVNFKDLFGGEETKKAGQEIAQTQTFLKQNLIDILGAVSPLYQATEEGRIQFEKLSEAAKDTNLSQEAADKVIKDSKQYLDNILNNQQKIDKLFKNNISTVEQYLLGFKNATLNAKDAQAFYKEYFDLKNNPLDMLGRSQNDLNMSVATTILNEDSRNRVIKQLTIEEDKLRAKLASRQITEDQYAKALEGLKDKIILEQRKGGTIFAEDFRGGRQAAREANALANETKLSDFAGAFFDEFDNSAADSYRQAQLGAKDTANTIKSEFNNAFLSFANGTATASDAFTKMALNVSYKIQQLALEFSTNLIFGKLFGTTSNMFGGGGGGGIGDFFGSLFKSKGGMVKGYSSGGNVTGGSGNKDDVPAMLSGGEYVIKKDSVNKYGSSLLHMINGGRINGFAYGGESSYNGTNVYRYNDPLYPTAGENVIDPRLSLQAIIDPNNPQNKIRQEREQSLYDYLNYAEGVRLENERALQENIDINKKIQDEYNQQKNAKSNGAWYQALFGLAGAGLSFVGSNGGFGGSSASKYGASATLGGGAAARQSYSNSAPFRYSTPTPRANGGYIRGFANGGSSGKDDIPAMLMGGEFVVRKEAVNMYGKKFFDDLNSGRAKKFADGGSVDNSSAGTNSTSYTPTNNVSVVVNLNQENVANENTKEDSNDEKRAEAQRTKELAEKVKTQVMRVITEQQRPGGLLSSAVYRKIQK